MSVIQLHVPAPDVDDAPTARQVTVPGAVVRDLVDRLAEMRAVAVAVGRHELADALSEHLRALDDAERRSWYREQYWVTQGVSRPHRPEGA